MNNDLNKKNNTGESTDVCLECGKNPCGCPDKDDTEKNETGARTEPPKLTWI